MKVKTSAAWLTRTALALTLSGCGGTWVDAPEACKQPWRALQLSYDSALVDQSLGGRPAWKPSSDDLRVAIGEELAQMRKAGASEKALQKESDAFEQLIALGARQVCSVIGKSYTGEWECAPRNQRVKCK